MEESPQPNVSSQQSTTRLLQNLSFQDVGQALVLVVFSAYVYGFIIVTAHLGRFGVQEYEIFRMQYLIAGGMFWILVGIFVFFMGRHMTTLDEDTAKYKKLFERMGSTGRGWTIWAFVLTFIEVVCFVVVGTVIAALILLPPPKKSINPLLIMAMIIGKFLIDFILTSAASERLSARFYVWTGSYMAAVIAGFLLLADALYYELFLIFSLMSMGLLYYMTILHHRVSKVFTAFIVILGLIGFSGQFGIRLYGHVKRSVGGGAPITVRLILSEQGSPTELGRTLNARDGISAPVDLLGETSAELLVGYGATSDRYEQLLRVKRDKITGLIFTDTRSR